MTGRAIRPGRCSSRSGPAPLSVTILTAAVILAATVAGAELSECPEYPDLGLGDRPWLLPFEFEVESDPVAQQQVLYEFMWRSFVALNWPALEQMRGEPDCGQDILQGQGTADRGVHRVWETYPGPLEVFLPPSDWDNYPTWENLGPPPGTNFGFGKIPPFAIVVNQPGLTNLSLAGADDFPTGPLVDQNRKYVRYQVGINRSYFEYIRKFEYYQRGKQIEAVQAYLRYPGSPAAFQPLPSGYEPYVQRLPLYARQGMVEIKAAWRELEGVEHQDRYIRQLVALDVIDTDVTKKEPPKLMGLVALHILRYTPNGPIAATFEQVDNVEVGPSAPEGLTPTFNDGEPPSPVERLIGFENENGIISKIPPPICASKEKCGESFNPPREDPDPISIYRVTPIPKGVQRVNAEFRAKLPGSPLRSTN